MGHSVGYEQRLEAAWRFLYATMDAVREELERASPAARQKALKAIGRALYRHRGLRRLPLFKAILADLRQAAQRSRRRTRSQIIRMPSPGVVRALWWAASRDCAW